MADSEDNCDEIMNKVKIFSSDDKKLKILGELLSNKSSRDIIKLLIDNEMYTNEIADKLDLRVNLVIHHLKKLEDLGLLQIQNKEIMKKGIDHKHYRISPYFFLAPSGTEEGIQTKRTLKKIFRDGIKFASIFLAGSIPILIQITNTVNDNPNTDFDRNLFPSISLFYGSLIIIIGLIIERIHSVKKRKKN